ESEDSYYLLIRRDAALNSTDSTLNLLFAKYESEDSYYLLIRRDAALNSTDSTLLNGIYWVMNGYDFNRYESEDSYYLLIRRDAALNSTDSGDTLHSLFALPSHNSPLP
uniref:hypothetical protein n=1 Tax=Daejeonella sp. TaxID=2805397 RepID=UPI0037847509